MKFLLEQAILEKRLPQFREDHFDALVKASEKPQLINDALKKEVEVKISTAFSRALRPTSDTTRVMCQDWAREGGRQRFIAYAYSLLADEYREGYSLGTALAEGSRVVVGPETLMWYPSNFGKLFSNRCKKQMAGLPRGVGKDGKLYSCRLLSGVTLKFEDPVAAHRAFVLDRTSYFRTTLVNLGKRPRAALAAKISKLELELESFLKTNQ